MLSANGPSFADLAAATPSMFEQTQRYAHTGVESGSFGQFASDQGNGRIAAASTSLVAAESYASARVDAKLAPVGSGADLIPRGGFDQAPPAQTASSGGFTGYLLDKIDDFEKSEPGQVFQGLPPEGFILGGAKAGLIWAGRVGQADGAAKEVSAAKEVAKEVVKETSITSQGRATSAAGSQLRADLEKRASVRADTSRDADYIARTDSRVAVDNRFDWDHVLTGEMNTSGKATGYHSEAAAQGAARITPGASVTQNSNGTYEAPVQIWSDAAKDWVDKKHDSTFFPADWSRARIEFEVSEAFKVKQMMGATKWKGTSPSGIEIEGYINSSRTTFYPLGNP